MLRTLRLEAELQATLGMKALRSGSVSGCALVLVMSCGAVAQEAGAWRKFGEGRQADAVPQAGTLTVPAGSWITVRVDQVLSSDRNQPGDAFTATLVKPVVVNGIVVARKGQTVAGRVAEAEKAGRVKGTSRLGLELTELGIVDGQQVPISTQPVGRHGDTSTGQDAAAIGTTAGAGAAIGALANGGFGAGMGAIAGAGAAAIAVLATRGRATVVYPETVLTFRLQNDLTISTERSPRAYLTVAPEDYTPQPGLVRQQPRPAAYPRRPYVWGPPVPYPYPWYGPGVIVYGGRRGYPW